MLEKTGRVWVVDDGKVAATPFLDLRNRVISDSSERGMYSIAFHPGFPADPLVYVAYTAQPDGRLVVSEHRVDVAAGSAQAQPVRVILSVPRPCFPNGEPMASHSGWHSVSGPATLPIRIAG